jgi:NitT/TauT family transport system ATP-binding protein
MNAAADGTTGRTQSGVGSIVVDDVSKVYQSRKGVEPVVAVQGVSFSIAPGEFVSLVGPSGCGKSTLLMMTAGLIPVTRGRVTIDDKPVTGPRRSVGVMFQTPELFRWRNVLENVLLPVDVFNLDRKQYTPRARELLRLVGLESFEKAYPQELSGGMEQRTALCRVLVADPSIVLMDEPFGALDEFTRERLNVELLRIWDATRKTVVFVTHNIGEAVFLSDRVIVMGTAPGRVLEDVRVELPRPRSIESLREPGYHATLYRIRDLLGLSR